MKNIAAFVTESRHIEVRETNMPACPPGYVKIKIEYCGICGSDVHFYEHGEPAFPDVYPFVLGHECAGEVVELGEGRGILEAGRPGGRRAGHRLRGSASGAKAASTTCVPM